MPEATIKTDFGDIRITYNNMEDLNAALKEIQDHAKVISKAVGGLIPQTPRIPKPGYEKVYRFLPTDMAELLIFPKKPIQLAVMVLFIYHPHMVSAQDLEKITGITDIAKKVLWQTNNKKYFRKKHNTYGLTEDGQSLFTNKVKPFIDAELLKQQPSD
jgi:hypothetical protein